MGAWIEMYINVCVINRTKVAPLVGAWIEIHVTVWGKFVNRSLPSWERGLKFKYSASSTRPLSVAPLVGAWIEICSVFPEWEY